MRKSIKSLSQDELKDVAAAVNDDLSPEELRSALMKAVRQWETPVTQMIARLVQRLRADLVPLFVAKRDLIKAKSVPTTRLLRLKDVEEILGVDRNEIEALGLVEKDGAVMFGELFLAVRNADVQMALVDAKQQRQNERFFVQRPMLDEIARKFPRSKPEEEYQVTVQRAGGGGT